MSNDGNDLRIRVARVEDAPRLAEAQRQIARLPGRLASTPAEIKDDAFHERILRIEKSGHGTFLVAEMNGAPVGHAILEPLKLTVTSHVVELTMAVHEGYQGRGIGKKLLVQLIDWARANPDVERIELRVRASNVGAIALYKKLGFIEEGRFVKRLKLGPAHYLDDLAMALWVGP